MLAGLLRTSNLVGPQQPRFDAAGAKDVPTIWVGRPTDGLLLLFVVAIRCYCKGIQTNATRSRNQPLPAGRRRRRLLVASFQYSSSIVVLIISISIIMLVISIPIRSSSSSRPNRHTRRWYPPLEHSRSSTQRIVVVIIVITVLALWFDHPVPMRLAQRHGIRLQRFRELGEQPLLLGGREMMMMMVSLVTQVAPSSPQKGGHRQDARHQYSQYQREDPGQQESPVMQRLGIDGEQKQVFWIATAAVLLMMMIVLQGGRNDGGHGKRLTASSGCRVEKGRPQFFQRRVGIAQCRGQGTNVIRVHVAASSAHTKEQNVHAAQRCQRQDENGKRQYASCHITRIENDANQFRGVMEKEHDYYYTIMVVGA